MRTFRVGLVAALVPGIVGAMLGGLAAPAAAVATGEPPAFVQTLGGPGPADLYPSGLEVAPDGTVVVADTGENRVLKYSAAGTLLWRSGTYGSGTGQFNNPRDIGIDSAGNIFVADTGNIRIVKLTPSGAWTTSWKGVGTDVIRSPIGLSVTRDAVYVADAGSKKVRVYSTAGVHQRSFGSQGACVFSALRDVDADSDGNVYVANYTLHNILKLSSTGTCVTRWGTKGTGAAQFQAPYGVRLAVDPVRNEELVYVADSNNNRISVFTRAGVPVTTMGAPGTHDQPGTFTQLRRVAVAADGDVWGADLWGWRLERFNRTASGWAPAQRVGDQVPQLTDTAAFNEPRGITFDAQGDLRVTDTVHHRVVEMTPQGRVLGSCGLRGSSDGEFNWPRSAAFDPASGDLWVADTKQSRLQVIDPGCAGGVRIGVKGTAVGQFDWPMAIAIRASDRTAWVADTNNNRITVWDVATRTPIRTFGSTGSGEGQFFQPRGIAVAPTTGNILVADRSNNRVVELSAGPGATGIGVVGTYTGGFNKPEGVAADDEGRIYVADTLQDRLVVLDAAGVVTGTTTGPDGLSDPASVAVGPDGRIYVSDTFGDRVQVFEFTGTQPDTTAPGPPVFLTPAANAVLGGSVTLSGTASDDVAVVRVDVAIQDRVSRRWWNAATSQFQTARVASPAATSTGADVTWSATHSLPPGDYLAQAMSTDAAGNTTPLPLPSRRFTVR